MPMKPLRPCKHPGCGELTRDGWCAAHRPKRERGAESASWHWMYQTDVWKRLRAEQLLEEPFCRECADHGRPRIRASDVDHREPHKGDWVKFTDKHNLQSLCHSCHSRKTLGEILAEKQRNFSKQRR